MIWMTLFRIVCSFYMKIWKEMFILTEKTCWPRPVSFVSHFHLFRNYRIHILAVHRQLITKERKSSSSFLLEDLSLSVSRRLLETGAIFLFE